MLDPTRSVVLATIVLVSTSFVTQVVGENVSVVSADMLLLDRLQALESEVAFLRSNRLDLVQPSEVSVSGGGPEWAVTQVADDQCDGHQWPPGSRPDAPRDDVLASRSAALGDSAMAKRRAYPQVRLTGFFQADVGLFHQSTSSVAAVGDIQDGADFRRARLAAIGDVAANVGYIVEFDFGFPGRPSFMDVNLRVRELPWLGSVTVGQYRQPIGIDGLTSAKDLTFIERGLPFALLPFRQIGVMASHAVEPHGTTWAISGFRFPTDLFGGQVGDNGGYGLATRATGVLWSAGDHSLVHVGGAYSFIDPANDAIRYQSQPEFFISETGGSAFVAAGVLSSVPPFVDTGVISTRNVNLLAAELAVTHHAAHAQAEIIHSRVDRLAASGLDFWGMSVQSGFLLTGEHRPYNRKGGVLGRVKPKADFGRQGPGAWEITGRWSVLDLSSGDVQGGVLRTSTLGLNWYLNGFTKIQLNYIHASADSGSGGSSDANVFAARAQVDF